jgi:Mrp family chromosome partitioning ATPase/capsular polysaccharide biosynthesis protein
VVKLQAIVKRRWPLLVLATVLGAVAGLVTAELAPKDIVQMYRAAQVVVANEVVGGASVVQQDSLRVTRGVVPTLAAARLGTPEEADALAATIEVQVATESRTFTVSTTDPDPEVALKRVDAFVVEFLSVTNKALQQDDEAQLKLLQADIDQAKSSLTAFDLANPAVAKSDPNLPSTVAVSALIAERRQLVDRITQTEVEYRRRQLEISETVPYESLGVERPKLTSGGLLKIPTAPPVRAVLLGFLGLSLGAVVVLIIERVQRRIDTRDELVQLIELPILAEIGLIPAKRRAGSDEGRVYLDGVWAEPYRRVRSAIQYVQLASAAENGAAITPAMRRELPPLSVMITSTTPGEGKSTSTALTGAALAELATPTLVVGADFRRPEVDAMLGARQAPTIRDLAEGAPGTMAVVDVVHETEHPDLYVAPAGAPTREVSGVIGAAKRVVREALGRGVMVVIDSSPLQVANDTLDLLPVVDYVIIVVRSGSSSADDLLDTIDTLERLNAKILGVILVGTPSVGKKQTSYYDYYASVEMQETPGSEEGASDSEDESHGGSGGDGEPRSDAGDGATDGSVPADVITASSDARP